MLPFYALAAHDKPHGMGSLLASFSALFRRRRLARSFALGALPPSLSLARTCVVLSSVRSDKRKTRGPGDRASRTGRSSERASESHYNERPSNGQSKEGAFIRRETYFQSRIGGGKLLHRICHISWCGRRGERGPNWKEGKGRGSHEKSWHRSVRERERERVSAAIRMAGQVDWSRKKGDWRREERGEVERRGEVDRGARKRDERSQQQKGERRGGGCGRQRE